jgi:hypothetical protein
MLMHITLTAIFSVKVSLRNVIYSTKYSVIKTGILANRKIESIVKETPCRYVFEKHPYKDPILLETILRQFVFSFSICRRAVELYFVIDPKTFLSKCLLSQNLRSSQLILHCSNKFENSFVTKVTKDSYFSAKRVCGKIIKMLHEGIINHLV